MGSPTLQARPLPPRTCVVTPKSEQVALWVEERTSSKTPLRRTRYSWRYISSSDTYGRRGRTVFTICVLWILTPPTTSTKTPRSAWKPLKRRRITIISMPASKIFSTSLPLLPQWKAFLGSRRRRQLNILSAISRRSVRIPTHVIVGMWRLGLWPLSSGRRAAVSRGGRVPASQIRIKLPQ